MELFAPRHLLVILLIVMVIFGTKKLRTIGSDLGGAIRGFKQAMKEGASEDHESHDVSTQPALPNTAPDTTGAGEAATKSQSQSTADANR